MNVVISLFEKKGLTSRERIVDLVSRRWTIPEIESLAEELYAAVVSKEDDLRDQSAQEDPLNAFTFLASPTMSGAAGCSMSDCRARSALTLARYAVLYADKIIAPMPLQDPTHHQRPRNLSDEFGLRLTMAGTLLSIHEMRPAIEAGFIGLVTLALYFCPTCDPGALGRMKRINSAAQRLANANRDRFSVVYDGSRPLPTFTVHGPREYWSHGEFGRFYYGVPSWLPKTRRAVTGLPLSPSVVRKSRIVDELFASIGAQVVLQEFLGTLYGAKGLTTNPGELSLLSQLDPKRSMYRTRTASLSRITHAIPLMEDIPLTRAVRIRKEEGDAFLVYRKALADVVRQLLKGSDVLTEKQATEIVSDVLQPEVAKLRQLGRSERGRAARKASYRLAFAGAILTLGLFRGLLPAEYAALGSAAALSGLVDSLADLRANPTALRNQNFYYLLRLTQ